MLNKSNQIHHEAICIQSHRRMVEECKVCSQTFNSLQELQFHLKKCGKFICFQCNLPFLTSRSLNAHIELVHKKEGHSNVIKLYKCSICSHICKDRSELYSHRMNQHGGNDNDDLNDIPQYTFEEQNENIREVYITNKNHILANHEAGDIRETYNFPVNNLNDGYREIRRQINLIYDDQTTVFRINFAFGMILFNNQTGEYRYYIPYYNSRILTYPYTISNRNSIRLLMNKITRIDIIEQARAIRPTTAWTLAFITNIQYNTFLTDFPLGQAIELPTYIKNHKHLRNFIYDKNRKEPYQDNLCFFRCLKVHLNNQNKNIKDYLKMWLNFTNTQIPTEFPGVLIEDVINLEKCFEVKIILYSLNANGTVSHIYETMSEYQSKMYLNVFQNHFSYITNFDQFAKKFQCDKCGKIFKRLWNMKTHYKTCYDRTKYIFPGGFYESKSTIFERLESIGIYVPNNSRYYPYFLVWDMEAMLRKNVDDNQSNTNQLQWISKHIPVSVSIASNIPQHEEPVCIVEVSPNLLVSKMMNKIQEISRYCYEIMKERYDYVYHELEVLKEQYSNEPDDSEYESEESVSDPKMRSHFANVVSTMIKEFDKYLSQVPVIGFNSGKYDLNLVKRHIMLYITDHYQENEIFTIKRNNSYLAIAVTDMKFLDISNYLAAGCSYSKFLKAYGCETPKGIFPYEWFDSEEKLMQNHLPKPEEFYSRLTNDNPIKTESVYQALLTIWRDERMETFKDYLIYYNNLDTAPFAIALQNFIDIYIRMRELIFLRTT